MLEAIDSNIPRSSEFRHNHIPMSESEQDRGFVSMCAKREVSKGAVHRLLVGELALSNVIPPHNGHAPGPHLYERFITQTRGGNGIPQDCLSEATIFSVQDCGQRNNLPLIFSALVLVG